MTLHRRTIHAFLVLADTPEPFAAQQSAGFAKEKSVIGTRRDFGELREKPKP